MGQQSQENKRLAELAAELELERKRLRSILIKEVAAWVMVSLAIATEVWTRWLP